MNNETRKKYFLWLTVLAILLYLCIIAWVLTFPGFDFGQISNLREKINLLIAFLSTTWNTFVLDWQIMLLVFGPGVCLVFFYLIPGIYKHRGEENSSCGNCYFAIIGIAMVGLGSGFAFSSGFYALMLLDSNGENCRGVPSIGLLSREMDNIYRESNDLLCSSRCPCSFEELDHYKNYEAAKTEQLFWTDLNGNSDKIQDCPEKEQRAIWENNAKTIKKFGRDVVFDLLGSAESQYQCSGWCGTPYFSEDEAERTRERTYTRYLFIGLDSEPKVSEENKGCFEAFIVSLRLFLFVLSGMLIPFTVLFLSSCLLTVGRDISFFV